MLINETPPARRIRRGNLRRVPCGAGDACLGTGWTVTLRVEDGRPNRCSSCIASTTEANRERARLRAHGRLEEQERDIVIVGAAFASWRDASPVGRVRT